MADINYDVDGTNYVTDSLIALLNDCPLLQYGERFTFAEMDGNGLTVYPTGGAVIQSERRSVTDHITQQCLYNFAIVYRLFGQTSDNKIQVKEFLDDVGRWLEREPVKSGDVYVQLTNYPELKGRTIKQVSRQSASYLESINEDQSENWVISMSLRYEREYNI